MDSICDENNFVSTPSYSLNIFDKKYVMGAEFAGRHLLS